MSIVRLTLAVLFLIGAAGAPSAFASSAKGKAEGKPSGVIEAKAPSDYLFLPRLHMAVAVDANRRYRTLDMEVWLHPQGPENLQRANSKKKQIAEAVREDLTAYNWEAFEDAEEGPKLARKVIEESVLRVSGAKLDDVLIKTLILK